jgi:hypothetical protein
MLSLHQEPAKNFCGEYSLFKTDMAPEQRVIYQIIVKGELDPSWSDWLSGFTLKAAIAEDGSCTTILCVPIADQAALRGTLTRLWDFNLEVVAIFREGDLAGPARSKDP